MSLLLLPLLLLVACTAASGQSTTAGEELPPTPTYLVLVPRKLRPEQELRVSTSVFRMLYSNITFRMSVRRKVSEFSESEVAFAEETFHRVSTRIVRIRIPENVAAGNYSLHVEGSVHPLGGLLFYNRTEMLFEPRLFSVFVQFSRPVYAMGDLLRFRVIPYESNLMLRQRVFTKIEVVDPQGTSVRRWMSPRSNAMGFVELSFQLPPTSNFGSWKVRCTHETFVTEKSFLVEYNTQSSMVSVNISTPQRLSKFAFGVYGILQANHTTNVPVTGTADIRLRLWPSGQPEDSAPAGSLWKRINYFSGRSEFLFTMSEISEALKLSTRPANMLVRADAFVHDWYYLVNETSYSYSYIFDEIPEIRFLGGKVRQFKPGFPFVVMMLVYQPDGQVPDFRNRQVKLDVYCNQGTHTLSESALPIPDDAVIRYTLLTSRKCLNYRLVAVLQTSALSKTAEQLIFRHYSPTGAYMQVSTTTEQPKVDHYMVFNVRTNYYSPQIHYLILAAGSILHSDVLTMPSGVESKTFSIALSREMAPVARIVTYYMKQDGELVTDSMSFFVDVLGVNSVKLEMTEGTDLTGRTATGWLTGAAPGAFALLSAMPFDLYLRYGSSVMLDSSTLLEELRSYESHAEQPIRHRWFNDTSDFPYVRHFPGTTVGPDANKTMNYSGLIMFTDSNYTKVTFWHTCNETENPDRAFPCYSGSHDECYGWRHVCNGVYDCQTGVDELNCDSESVESLPGFVQPRFRFEFRHFAYDDSWMWQQIYVKPFPGNRMPIHHGTIPKLETSWVIGAMVLDRQNGIQLQEAPARFSSRRRFYMVLECPSSAFWGEQIGVRVALFNRWDYWTEVIVEMKQTNSADFVKVGWFGHVDSYAPETVANRAAHTVVYMRAGSQRTVYFPILPRRVGNNVVTFCAYSFNGGECSTVTVSVSMNGIANSYHSPILLDLVSQSELLSHMFHIMPEQDFSEPERRWRRFVPGSKTATFTIVGDVVGPTFDADMPVGDTDNVAWKPHGSAESILFNINWNVQMLHYLRMTRQLRGSTQQPVLEFVNTQFARLAFYIDPSSGGIANFPERFLGETSTFLTAFGAWTLAEAAFSEWERTVYFGTDVFRRLLGFLDSAQTKTGDPELLGSFDDAVKWDLKYFDAYIRDSVGGNRTILERVPVTALAVIAVTHPSVPKPIADVASRIASAGLGFLRRHLRQIANDQLGLAMAAYALSFDGGTSAKHESVQLLRSSVRSDNYLYWANRRLLPLIREGDTAGRTIIKPRVEWPNDALAVQATSFGLLALYKSGSVASDTTLRQNITKLMNFVVETKNSPRGWISTQDTVFAVRALREVAQLDFNREIYQLRVSLVPSSDITQVSQFTLSGSNLSVPRTVSYSNNFVWGELQVRAEGSGRAVLQLNAQKNVDQAFLVKNAADPLNPSGSLQTFEMTCVPRFTGRNSSILHMTTCARWVWTDRSETSGMSVMSYTVPTGFRATNFALRNFVQNSTVRGLRHIWMSGNTINIFFTNITSLEPTCLTLTIPRWHPVANVTIEQSCSVYEYFENDNGNFTIYSARSLFSNDICKVCGSFQCPYCPDYNTSSALLAPPPLLLLLLLLLPLLLLVAARAAAAE